MIAGAEEHQLDAPSPFLGNQDRHTLAQALERSALGLARELQLELLTHPQFSNYPRHEELTEQLTMAMLVLAQSMAASAYATNSSQNVLGIFGLSNSTNEPFMHPENMECGSGFLQLSLMATAGGWQFGIHEVNRLGQRSSGRYTRQVADIPALLVPSIVRHFKPMPLYLLKSDFGQRLQQKIAASTVVVGIL